jgi:hypothetical protein
MVLPLVPAAAFELFTGRIDEWWPADRRHFQGAPSQIFMLRSGRFYERTRDERAVELGRVRAWDFPRQILLDFCGDRSRKSHSGEDHFQRAGWLH